MAMEAQLQIRQNAMEVQEYLSDLFAWEKSIKQSEKKAQGSVKHSSTSNGSAPAPRGRAETRVETAPVALQAPGLTPSTKATSSQQRRAPASKAQGTIASTAASHTYSSYSKWDKLDVDAMLQSDDEDSGATATVKRQPPAQPASTTTPESRPHAAVRPAPVQPAVQIHDSGADMTATSTRRTAAPSATSTASGVPGQPAETDKKQPSRDHPPVRNAEPQTADSWRLRGNDLYKTGNYAYAKDCYTRCIEQDPDSAVAYANRAMAELKLGQWREAEEDCTQALSREPHHVKALHRRGVARQQLGDLLQAAQDFELCLRLEPTNKSVAADRDAALSQYMQQAHVPPMTLRSRVPVSCATPTPPAPPQPAQATESPVAAAAAPAAATGPTPEKRADSVAVAQGAAVTASAAVEATASAAPRMPQPGQEGATSPAGSRRQSGSGAGDAAASKARLAAAAAAAAQQLASRAAAQAKPPKTSTEFEAMWRTLVGDTNQAQRLAYLSLLQPTQLPSVFKTSLTPQLLTSILETVLAGTQAMRGGVATAAEPSDTEEVDAGGEAPGRGVQRGLWSAEQSLAFLEGLVCVPRVEMTAMCVGSGKKAELRAAWSGAFAGCRLQERLQRVQAALKL